MAAGFTPKHTAEFPLNELTPQDFLVLANEAAAKTGWKTGFISSSGLIAYTDNGIFSSNAEIKIKIEDGTARIQSASTGSEMVDWGRNKKNTAAFIAAFEELKQSLTKEELDTKYQELKEQLVPDEEDILKLPPASAADNIKSFFSIFKPVQGFFITPILLNLNILIFAAMAASGVNILQPDNESLLNWGANFRPLTLDGQWWRLLTNCFLHIGIVHLFMNMYALLYIGVLLEPRLGRTRFIAAYLLAGTAASAASLWWHSMTISAGASGAIFGMYGVFLAMLTTDLIEKTARKALLTSIAVFVGYSLLYGLKGGIDNAAHIGGLLCGLLIGYAFIPSLKKPEENKLKFGTIGLTAVLILASSFMVYKKMPDDFGTYQEKMKEFVSMESMALEVYNIPQSAPRDEVLYGIKERGIYYWNENIKLMESCEDLDLPPALRARNRLLKEYCRLRLKCYELLYKAVSEDSDQYQAQIEDYNKQIDEKIRELTGRE